MTALPHTQAPHSVAPRLLFMLGLLSLIPLTGCQRDTGPAAPALAPEVPLAAAVDATPTALGLFQLTGNLDTLDISLSPFQRTGNALADTFAVDVTSLAGRFFRIDSVGRPAADQLRVTFRFQHPLPDTTARRDLHIFDVRVHALVDSSTSQFEFADGLKVRTGAGGAEEPLSLSFLPVLNADGYSSWADEVAEPLAGFMEPNVHPFWRVHEDTGRATFNSSSPAGWNVVPMATTPYLVSLDFSTASLTSLSFLLAVEASYGASAFGPLVTPVDDPGGRKNPKYFLPHFNLKEAWKATATVTGTPTVGASNTKADVELTVFDHQGGLTAAGAFDALTAPQSSLRYASDLESATLSIPQALSNPITITRSAFTGQGTPASPYIGKITVRGDQLSGVAGDYRALVAIRDSQPAGTLTLSPLGTLGVQRNLAPIERHDFATYLPITITTQTSTNQAPTADVQASSTTVASGGTTMLSPGPGTMDPDGMIALYEYDFDYDGSNFTVDAMRSTTAPVTSPALTGPDSLTMAMRVTDNGAPALSAIDTVVITVQAPANVPPNADLDVTPTTVESGATAQCSPGPGTNDPDGSITLYQYDFDYDGVNFTVDASNTNGATVVTPPLSNPTPSPIQRTMAMRVTDNGTPGLTDIDAVLVTINGTGGSATTWTEIHDIIMNGPADQPAVPACIECHIDGPNGLFMTADKNETYMNLVNVQSTCLDPYVVPNDHMGSFVYQKISMDFPLCGERMPRKGPYLSSTNIARFVSWIDDGAQNN